MWAEEEVGGEKSPTAAPISRGFCVNLRLVFRNNNNTSHQTNDEQIEAGEIYSGGLSPACERRRKRICFAILKRMEK